MIWVIIGTLLILIGIWVFTDKDTSGLILIIGLTLIIFGVFMIFFDGAMKEKIEQSKLKSDFCVNQSTENVSCNENCYCCAMIEDCIEDVCGFRRECKYLEFKDGGR